MYPVDTCFETFFENDDVSKLSVIILEIEETKQLEAERGERNIEAEREERKIKLETEEDKARRSKKEEEIGWTQKRELEAEKKNLEEKKLKL